MPQIQITKEEIFNFIEKNPNKVFDFLQTLCTTSDQLILICEKIRNDIQQHIQNDKIIEANQLIVKIQNFCKIY